MENSSSRNTTRDKAPFLQFLKVMGTPVEGWKGVKRSKTDPDVFARHTVYPLSGLAALSQLMTVVYRDTDLSVAIETGLVVFVAFFLGYFIFMIGGLHLLPINNSQSFSRDFWKKFAAVIISSLALLYVVYSVAQPLQTALVFLPFYTFYLIYRGMRFLRLKTNKESLIICILCIASVGIPLIIANLLLWMLPSLSGVGDNNDLK